MNNNEMLSIGEFGRRARLTPKALRIYDQLGLLSPASTDPVTGYRRYRPDQVRTGQLISVLRGADLSLADIGLVVEDIARDVHAAIRRLDALLADSARRHADHQLLIRHVQVTIGQGGDPMFPIETRHVTAQRVMSIQRRLHGHETDGFVREAKKAFADHLRGAAPAGPFTLIFHGVVDAEHDGPLEAMLACPAHIQPDEQVGVRTEPAHDEAYTTITKAQWDFPAILAAYDAVACSSEATARPNSHLSCREVYRAEPDDIGPDDVVCDIAFPLGDPPAPPAQNIP
ncbi:MAG TPA: MerR family transcriptional regulator [Acidimicrobiales bacterium]|nr:MerR family transcriptional regulator [Acidimicrobiales bacterium]